jgi:serine/threonine protein kinase
VHGITQDPNTKDYIIVLEYAKGGSFNNWLLRNKGFSWRNKLIILPFIINGLDGIHKNHMIHHDFHTGNILLDNRESFIENQKIFISDMGLCGEVGNTDETKLYGVVPYMAPEVLRGNPYTQAADIYSLGMIMYFIATGRQPFYDRDHDQYLILDICEGVRPKINPPEAPQCYIDLMKRCWDPNPVNRPNTTELNEMILLFWDSINLCDEEHDIRDQFNEAEAYRKNNLPYIKDDESNLQVIQSNNYVSRLIDCYNPRYDSGDFSDCAITD